MCQSLIIRVIDLSKPFTLNMKKLIVMLALGSSKIAMYNVSTPLDVCYNSKKHLWDVVDGRLHAA